MKETNTPIIEINDHLAMWTNLFADEFQNFYPSTPPSLREEEIPNILTPFKHIQEFLWSKFQMHYQIFDTAMLLNHEQLRWALYHSDVAFVKKSNISKNPEVEFLLYLSQQRQIKLAFENVGVKTPSKPENSLHCGEILFGSPENLPPAIEALKEIHDHTPFTPISYLPETAWNSFIQCFDIPIPQILTTLKSYNLKVDLFQNEDHPIELTHIQKIISIPTLEKAIIDIYNQGLLTLFLTNLKGLKATQPK